VHIAAGIIKVASGPNPLSMAAIQCTGYACRKVLVPKLTSKLRDIASKAKDDRTRIRIHNVLDVLQIL